MLPLLGSLLLLLLVLAALYLWHQGKLPLPKLGGHRSPEPRASSPNASPVGTSAQMSSWNGPASWTGLPVPIRCRPSLERTAAVDLGAREVYPTGSSALRVVVVSATNAGDLSAGRKLEIV